MEPISGFSKLSKLEKIDLLSAKYFSDDRRVRETFKRFWHHDETEQRVFDEFSENTLTNFYMPYGVVPNLKINGKNYCVPMVIEESSVVAACARSANFWFHRGGFKAQVISNTKIGQVHLQWKGDTLKLFELFQIEKASLLEEVTPFVKNMIERGGGIKDIELRDLTHLDDGYFQLWCTFDTCDAMGANFINTVLETFGRLFKDKVSKSEMMVGEEKNLQVVMAILSNYTPDSRVRVEVSCPISELEDSSLGMSAEEFASKFYKAVKISKMDVNRATTHNKGIFNGIDAVVLATGNDYRAVEACGHTYASRDGQYRGLSDCSIQNGEFHFSLELPMSIGTVGGLTRLHPMARTSLDMLGRPNASELMQIIATVGLAQNFAALRSLTTSGIQKGHMKMHLMNILNHLEANEPERDQVRQYFEDKVISFKEVREYLGKLRHLV